MVTSAEEIEIFGVDHNVARVFVVVENRARYPFNDFGEQIFEKWFLLATIAVEAEKAYFDQELFQMFWTPADLVFLLGFGKNSMILIVPPSRLKIFAEDRAEGIDNKDRVERFHRFSSKNRARDREMRFCLTKPYFMVNSLF